MSQFPILHPPPSWATSGAHVELWHGCLEVDAIRIRAGAVNPTVGAHATDFGRVFYTTTVRRQAEAWARKRYLDAAHDLGPSDPTLSTPVVLWFRVPSADLAAPHTLSFVLGDFDNDRYWGLVHHCRKSPPRPASPHDHLYPNPTAGGHGWYDVVTGPVAAFWDQRVAMVGADQTSFHTPESAAVLNALLPTRSCAIYPVPYPPPGGQP